MVGADSSRSRLGRHTESTRRQGRKKERPPQGWPWLKRGWNGNSSGLLGLGLFFPALLITFAPTSLFNLIALFTHKNLYFANPVRLVNRCNMKIQRRAFNTYFLGLWLALLVPWAGVQAAESTNDVKKVEETKKKRKRGKKEYTIVHLHLEVPRDTSGRSQEIQVLREQPIVLNVEKAPFLSESLLADARIVETPGGKEIELSFNNLGQTVLGNFTAANRGRRLAIFAEWDKEKRWLAAPKITKLLSDGVLRFTADATQEETERIVRGLSNMAEIKKRKDKF